MLTPSSGDLIAGKYRIESLLARGGMGEVWTAHNLSLDVPVALKLMSAQALSSAELVQRFEREAKAAAQLRHPNVVTIFDHGVFEEVPFMVMELLEGQDLSARLKQRGRLSHADAMPIITGACKALRRAHEMHVVHRDLKPANVFLARQDDEEIVKVLDFGIAKIVGGEPGVEPTRAGSLLGTPHYMAPEQARDAGVPIDHRADMWALGVIAFRMLTGKLPFAGSDPVMILLRICTEAPPSASSIAPDLEPDVDAFFTRALARHPANRFQSARDFAEAFAALGAHALMDHPWQSRSSAPPPQSRSSAPPPAEGGALLHPELGTIPLDRDSRMSHPGLAPVASRAAEGTRRQFFQRSSFPPAPPESSVPRSKPPPGTTAPIFSPAASARSPTADVVLDSARTLPMLPSGQGQPVQAHSSLAGHARPGNGTIPMVAGGGTVPLIRAARPAAGSPSESRAPARAHEPVAMPALEASTEARTIVRGSSRATSTTIKRFALIVPAVVLVAILMIVVGWKVISSAESPLGTTPSSPAP